MSDINYKEIAQKNKFLNISSFKIRDKSIVKKDGDLIDKLLIYIEKEHMELIREIQTGEKSKEVLEEVIEDYSNKNNDGLYQKQIRDIVDLIIGWGKIEELVLDPEVSHIFINELKVIKRVKNEDHITDIYFNSSKELERFIKIIAIRSGVKTNNYYLKGFDRKYKVKFNAAICKGAGKNLIDKPFLNLKKCKIKEFTSEELLASGDITDEIYDFYQKKNIENLNIIIVGEKGSGKSTHLHFLQKFKKPFTRTIVLSENAHDFKRVNTVTFNHIYDGSNLLDIIKELDGKNLVIEDVKTELKDVYEIIDMGCKVIYTINGNSCMAGLENTGYLMALENNLTYNNLMKKICSVIDYVIHIEKGKVAHIAKVKGYDVENKKPILAEEIK